MFQSIARMESKRNGYYYTKFGDQATIKKKNLKNIFVSKVRYMGADDEPYEIKLTLDDKEKSGKSNKYAKKGKEKKGAEAIDTPIKSNLVKENVRLRSLFEIDEEGGGFTDGFSLLEKSDQVQEVAQEISKPAEEKVEQPIEKFENLNQEVPYAPSSLPQTQGFSFFSSLLSFILFLLLLPFFLFFFYFGAVSSSREENQEKIDFRKIQARSPIPNYKKERSAS